MVKRSGLGFRDVRGFLGGWRPLLVLLALGAIVAITIGLQLALRREEVPGIIPQERADLGGKTVELLFPDDSGEWVRERREILASNVREEEVRRLLNDLIAGPRSGASPVFPAQTRLEDVFWDGEGELTLSFSEHVRSDHPGGSRAEVATIQSILGTVKTNFPDVLRVRILVEGETVSSIAGHVDISRALDAFVPR